MSALSDFLATLKDYGTNNVSALDGKIQYTLHERDDLKKKFEALPGADRIAALQASKEQGLDVANWGDARLQALGKFLSALGEHGGNSVGALGGKVQFTHNEREDLKQLLTKVDAGDRKAALAAATAKGLDTTGWA